MALWGVLLCLSSWALAVQLGRWQRRVVLAACQPPFLAADWLRARYATESHRWLEGGVPLSLWPVLTMELAERCYPVVAVHVPQLGRSDVLSALQAIGRGEIPTLEKNHDHAY
jgi:hypothetical protein